MPNVRYVILALNRGNIALPSDSSGTFFGQKQNGNSLPTLHRAHNIERIIWRQFWNHTFKGKQVVIFQFCEVVSLIYCAIIYNNKHVIYNNSLIMSMVLSLYLM